MKLSATQPRPSRPIFVPTVAPALGDRCGTARFRCPGFALGPTLVQRQTNRLIHGRLRRRVASKFRKLAFRLLRASPSDPYLAFVVAPLSLNFTYLAAGGFVRLRIALAEPRGYLCVLCAAIRFESRVFALLSSRRRDGLKFRPALLM